MASKIFVSYRRDDDPSAAARVRDGLAQRFGKANVFMDVDNLLAGQRFDEELAKALGACDVLIAILGPRWTELLKERQSARERDFVCDEIGQALERRIVIVPVRVGREGKLAALPRAEELPKAIRNLVLYQKHDVTHERFARDIDDLCSAIATVRRGQRPRRIGSVSAVISTLAVLGVAAGAVAFYSGVQLPAPSGSKQVASANDSTASERAAAQGARAKAEQDAKAKAAQEAKQKAEVAAVKARKDQEDRAARAEQDAKRIADAAKKDAQVSAAKSSVIGPATFALAAPLTIKLQSNFPSTEATLAKLRSNLQTASQGTVTIEPYFQGQIIQPSGLLDAVSKGLVAGWGSPLQWVTKHRALYAYDGRIPFGPSVDVYARWLVGEGGSLLDQLYTQELKLKVKSLPCGLTEPSADWFKRKLTSVNDLRGMKIRAVGTAIDILKDLGAAPVVLPITETYQALNVGVIDATLGGTVSSDLLYRFNEVAKSAYYPSWAHPYGTIELLLPLDTWTQLGADGQRAVKTLCSNNLSAAVADVATLQTKQLAELVSAQPYPPEFLAGLKPIADAQVAKLRTADKFTDKVIASLSSAR